MLEELIGQCLNKFEIEIFKFARERKIKTLGITDEFKDMTETRYNLGVRLKPIMNKEIHGKNIALSNGILMYSDFHSIKHPQTCPLLKINKSTEMKDIDILIKIREFIVSRKITKLYLIIENTQNDDCSKFVNIMKMILQ